VTTTGFGAHPDGRAVRRITIGTPPGPVLDLLDLGATVHRLEVTCGDGARRNVVLGFPTPAAYLADTSYVGGTIGRYANRIAGGTFDLDGRQVRVATNDRGHHLHGGPDGFDRRMWDVVDVGAAHAVLRLLSPDGDQGFPGELTATARFDALHDRIAITLTAVTDAPTVANLTSHAYFELGDDQTLAVAAETYTPVDATGIPVGGHAPVAGTTYDFRSARPVGDALVDHNYVVDGTGLRTAAVLSSAQTRTRVEVCSDQPGLQVFTGNPLGGIALEPQRFPDSPHHDEFPSVVLRPGESYRSVIEWVVGPMEATERLGP
jgi:aldose 1-epimerase